MIEEAVPRLVERIKTATNIAKDSDRLLFEAKRETLREMGRVFKALEKDPIILGLREYCKATRTIIPCTDSWNHVVATTLNITGDEKRIALTGNGFRVVTRFLESEPYRERRFPFNKLLSLGFKAIIKSGTTPGSVRGTLYKAAEEVATHI